MTVVAQANALLVSKAGEGQKDEALAHVAARLAVPVAKGLGIAAGFEGEVVTSSGPAVFGKWQRQASASFAYELGLVSMMVAVDHCLTGTLVERRFGGSRAGPVAKSSGQCRASAAMAQDIAGLVTRSIADAWPGERLTETLVIADATQFARVTDPVATITLSCAALGQICVAFAIEGMARISDVPATPRIVGWDTKLRASVVSARLPVRAVLARPEFPSATILRLVVGDVLPIPKPATVPLYAGVHRVATAVLTDIDGRTAVKILTMEPFQND